MTLSPAERALLEPTSPQWGEHRSRYHHAAPHVAGKLVLDVACGTGFGAAILLASGARGVIGFDLAWDALRESSRIPHALFCLGDGTRLPVADHTFDVVTSFETVEHIPNYDAFLSEIHRVLRPGGVLIMSTPNAIHTQPINGVPRNPYHVKEFTPAEFHELLAAHFSRVEVQGQRPSAAHRPCPYWEGTAPQPSLGMKLKAAAWKAAARLPRSAHERLWRSWRGVSFYPGERDFIFETDHVDRAHVLVGVCER